MDWFGQAEINFTHARHPRPVREKDGAQTDLLKIVEQSTPPCNLNPLLFNGHVQTMWTATRPAGPKIYYKRKIFDADHQTYRGTFAVDFVSPPHELEDPSLSRRTAYFTDEELENYRSDDSKPMLVVLHGLSGGSHEIYLRHCIEPLIGDGGWEACVVNFRGCARHKITSGVLYNARATWDMRQTIAWLQERFPNRPLFGLGFSLGANMLTNYCGEEGANCPLKGAVVCSNPFNLEVSSKMLQNTYIGREVYLRIMGSSLKDLARTNKDALEKYSKVDLESLMDITYLNEFDRLVQCPTWGYPTEYAYYRDASSTDAVLSIQIPFLAVHSTDDPIAIKEAIPFEEFQQNPNTILLTTSLGGHLCWFEIGGSRWFVRPVANFLNHLAFKTDLDSLKPQPSAIDLVDAGHNYVPMRRKMVIGEEIM
ncbi:Alpha/Beta hydrolase protein [Thelonectria olida]|uniref:alcohol O-acetyltransferase n=1 Tax=Thelonectria olida TaxID=1576542 RepID=A0A9P8WA86_9HYPO|nr:Alpha/Beta hydrolase protein [Thelonectria olida]